MANSKAMRIAASMVPFRRWKFVVDQNIIAAPFGQLNTLGHLETRLFETQSLTNPMYGTLPTGGDLFTKRILGLCYMSTEFSNQNKFKVNVTAYVCVPRYTGVPYASIQDMLVTSTPIGLGGAGASINPGYSPFDCAGFPQYFRVLRVKRRGIPPGGTWNFKITNSGLRLASPGRNHTQNLYTGGETYQAGITKCVLYRIEGELLVDSDQATTPELAKVAPHFVCARTKYDYTWKELQYAPSTVTVSSSYQSTEPENLMKIAPGNLLAVSPISFP